MVLADSRAALLVTAGGGGIGRLLARPLDENLVMEARAMQRADRRCEVNELVSSLTQVHRVSAPLKRP